MKTNIYLDHAAATQLDSEVHEAMLPYQVEQYYNPSATYLKAKKIKQDIESARSSVANILGVKPREIIFTAGATEANNLAIKGIMSNYPDKKILVSSIEHSSVLEPAKEFNSSTIPVDKNGQVKLGELEKLVTDDVVLISIMYANNEIGSIQQLPKISQIIRQIKADRANRGIDLPLYFHSDAAQAPNYLPLNISRLGVDLMSLNGGKIYGPKQSGVLFVATGVNLFPQILGGGQEFGIRSGTENVAGIIGFAQSLIKAVGLRTDEEKRLFKLKNLFIDQLVTKIPSVCITASKNSLNNIVHFYVPGIDNERVMMELDEQGIMCAVGSACSASSDEPSHVLKAIGLTDSQAQSSLRFSMGRTTTEADITKTVEVLAGLLA